jgi:hypothetical protein
MASEKFTAAAVAEALTKNEGLVYMTARKLGCSHVTVYRYIKRHPTVKAAFDAARGFLLDTAELKLRKAIQDGEQWAVTFALRTIGKDRGYTERQEISGPGGEPQEHIIRPSEELQELIREAERLIAERVLGGVEGQPPAMGHAGADPGGAPHPGADPV